MTPEAKARIVIDKNLELAGYVIQDMKEFNRFASKGVAVREYMTSVGPADYVLFIDGEPVGVIEAKKSDMGENITMVEEQSLGYAKSKLKWIDNKPLRFLYESTDIIINFTDLSDEKCRARKIFNFHTPEQLSDWIKEEKEGYSTLRNRLKHNLPELPTKGYRDCQIIAIKNLEKSFADNKPRALIQMATGAGKTFTAISFIYRLLKYAKAKRILFLVDTKNLGEQAETEFQAYKPNDDVRLFTELYNVQRLNSSNISNSANVCISTIQRMYSILRGEDLDEQVEENVLFNFKPKEIKYNQKYPCEFFDFIIIDECHRSIYNVWQQVLDYFDAFQIGLTATPDKRTFGYFNENVVSEYSREQAIIDGVNVGEDEYIIETKISTKGGYICKQNIQKRDRLSRKTRWEEMDDDLVYEPTALDRTVVNKSTIRNIIRAFKEALPKMFPNRRLPDGRQEVPKTLIFAKTDSHADDIINIVREEFGEGNEFCKKITYHTEENPKTLLGDFRNSYYPRIAVTVDMIATGTDVKPLECLLFMRDVRSKNYYEQMKGRGTRTCNAEDMQKVNKTVHENKQGFVIVDAVGVTKSKKSDSRPLERKPSMSLKDLLMNIAGGNITEDIMISTANRLIRLDKVLTDKERESFKGVSGYQPKEIISDILNAYDEDFIKQGTQKHLSIDREPTKSEIKEYQTEFVKEISKPFCDPKFREVILQARSSHDQIIDTVNIDEVISSGWSSEQITKAEKVIETFKQFIQNNKDEIDALSIIYNKQYRERPLTFAMLEELYAKLKYNGISYEQVWNAYGLTENSKTKVSKTKMLTDIVSLVKYSLGYTTTLAPFSAEVNENFKKWVFAKNAGGGSKSQFTDEQMQWLRMIKDHITTSLYISPDDLELSPFDVYGGLGKFYQLFEKTYGYMNILNEMNTALIAA